MRNRSFFDGIDDMDGADIHNALNCLEIVADTFVEMQRRLGAKPRFRRAAITQEKRDE
jgi:DNA polymerase III epsilon subunit-like protein